MKISPTSLHGVVICQPAIYQDNRGFFLESWNKREFGQAVDADISFVQDNRSHSTRDVLRGMHDYCNYLRNGTPQTDRIDTFPFALIPVRRLVDHAVRPVRFHYWLNDHSISGFFLELRSRLLINVRRLDKIQNWISPAA